jgi:lysophospholipase L1-like esterase
MSGFGVRNAALVLGLGVATTMMTPALAAEKILPLGNSITQGQVDPAAGGYRKPLQQLLIDEGYALGDQFDFIGGLDDGSAMLDSGRAMDDDHWGRPGALAADAPRTSDGIGGAVGDPILNQDIQARPGEVFAGGPADVVMLNIGTNAIVGDTESAPAFDDDSVDEAVGQFGNLLSTMQTAYQQDLSRDQPRFAEDVQFIVAGLPPKASSGVPGTTPAQAVVNTARYNARLDDRIDLLEDDFAARFSQVDLFSIRTSEILTQMQTLDVSQGDLDALDPDDDGLVDWVIGDGSKTFDETAPAASDFGGINGALLNGDGIHPTELGYKVIASVWRDKLVSLDAVPEPTSLAFLAGGATLLATRRRRRG